MRMLERRVARAEQLGVDITWIYSPPYLEQWFQWATGIDLQKQPITWLQVGRPFGITRFIRFYTYPERQKIRKYHFIKGLYTWDDMRSARILTTYDTMENSTIQKVSGRILLPTMLRGYDARPAALYTGNIYIGYNLYIHYISKALIPPDLYS
eukprot:TRINITY_DN18285_c0_g1_i2.p1 TRINITY_DN18285_c0_g1~~TRINITY_DN18285_c0_g1_i2.p1  ORF type:complete len:153 (-),score=1.65 TRINITY_DN18285_c0_g1_i2:60-518(-)